MWWWLLVLIIIGVFCKIYNNMKEGKSDIDFGEGKNDSDSDDKKGRKS